MQLVSPQPSPPLQPGAASGSAARDVVIATKLYVPPPPEQPVARPRLERLLAAGTGRARVTLVVAPAGWGKSSLVSQWLHAGDVRAGWLSLDRGDDDVARFWRYLLTAADSAAPGLAATALRRLDAPGSEVLRDVLPVFLNELSAQPGPVLVVLDDYHAIADAAVHESVRQLVERAPDQLHLVLISRSDPPLPTSRLRVAGRLVELRAEQLRFTTGEAGELLERALGAPLGEQDVTRLVARTEGWVAGLQLAGLRLADRPDARSRSEFIARFTGADRHVVDYLGEEVLAAQPDDVRAFLLQTSVLDRLCGALADAVTGRDDGAQVLDRIHRANLFLNPLDDEQRWFRYHQLFRGILQHELARIDPRRPAALHRRAAGWYAAAGQPAEAIGHAVASGDTGYAAQLVAAGWRDEFNAGHLKTVRGWLDALPADRVAADPQLAAGRVWLALDAGRLADADAAITAAERMSPADPQVRVLRALHTYKAGDVRGTLARLEVLADAVTDPFLRTVRDLLTGVCLLWLAEFDRAARALRAATESAADDGNVLARVYALGCRALVHVESGDLGAVDTLLAAAEDASEPVGTSHFVAMFPALSAARLAALRGDAAAAAAAGERAVELGRRGAGRVELAAALLTHGELGEARALLRECADPGPLVLDWLRVEQRSRPAEPAVDALTERELAILRLLPGPLTQREIAGSLFVTPNTLKTHLRAIYRKLGADSRLDAVSRARSLGVL